MKARSASGAPTELTRREIEVLRLVGRGWGNRQISERLRITVLTVENHIDKLHSKLYTHNRVQLVLQAHCHGYVLLNEIDYGVTVEMIREHLKGAAHAS